MDKNLIELKQKVVGDRKLVVTFTSFPARIGTVHIPVERMLKNSIAPDKIVLYLAKTQFQNELEDVSEELRGLLESEPKFEIRFVEKDRKQFKGLMSAVRDFPDDYIVNIDDDMRYRYDTISALLSRAAKHPGCIIGNYVRLMRLDKRGEIMGYFKGSTNKFFSNWFIKGKGFQPQFRYYTIQTGGALYPPNSLHKDFIDEAVFEEFNPQSGDIYFWIMAIRAGTKTVPARIWKRHRYVRGSQKVNLRKINNARQKNGTRGIKKDEILKTNLEHFSDAYAVLREES